MLPRITPLGDSAFVAELAERVGELSPARVHALSAHLQSLPGVDHAIPASTSLTLLCDPLRHDAPALHDRIAQHLAAWFAMPDDAQNAPATRLIEIPVCYGGDHGIDLEEVAARTGLSTTEVIALHSGADYQVLQLGFAPGFAYLHGLPESLNLPRRESPRLRVEAGSVAIANGQCCIYPSATPGGWHVIGRTPQVMFHPTRPAPALLQPGDRIRFRPITADEFQTLTPTP